jgi:hypothetical protein
MATGDQLVVWRAEGFELRMYDDGTDDDGREVIRYVLHDNSWRDPEGQPGRKLFKGTDFRPSPLHAVDSPESIAALLGFLSMAEGDTDGEYFDNYTERQFAWVDSERRELLATLVIELEEGARDE